MEHQEENPQKKPWYVYLLVSTTGATYVGATVDPDKRLRQHNCEISGGARATRAKVGKGETWTRHCYVGPFEKIDALRFEWRWKFVSRKLKGNPLERRLKALESLMDENKNIIFENAPLEA